MWFLKACRGCLTTEGNLEAIDQATARAFSTIVGFEIKSSDGFPSCLCFECKAYIKKAAVFRRKARRAHFILTEIMSVKNQVTLADIHCVDRQKTNLKSSLCQPSTPEVVDIQPVSPEEKVVEREKIINDVLQEIQEDQIPIEDDFNLNDEIVDSFENDNVVDRPLLDLGFVDLEDIFKDLKEPSESELESPEEEEEEVKEEENRAGQKNNHCKMTWKSYRLKQDAEILANTDIKYVDEERQKENHMLRTRDPSFSSHCFKCAICIKIFSTRVELLEHCQYHNETVKEYKHVCSICKNRFETEVLLYAHCMTEHWYEYKCSNCGKKHITWQQLKNCYKVRYTKNSLTTLHFKQTKIKPRNVYRLTGNVGQFVCPLCNVNFKSQNVLNRHQKQYHGSTQSKAVFCDICKRKFKSKSNLSSHIQQNHLYKYTCKLCKKVLYNVQAATIHLGVCPGRKPDTSDHPTSSLGIIKTEEIEKPSRTHCSVCGKPELGAKELYLHQLQVHGYIRLNTVAELNDPRFFCLHCHVYFLDEEAYFKHICYNHVKEAGEYEHGCLSCLKLFESAQELKNHVCLSHKLRFKGYSNNYVFKYRECFYCKKIMATPEEYVQHCKDNHPGNPYDVEQQDKLCDICGKIYSKISISSHLKTHKQGQNREKCKFCEHKSTPTALVQHILASHTYKPYLCQKCPKRYEYKWECREHLLKVHAPVLPYRCEACSRRFAHLDYLNDHCVKVHGIDLKKTDRSVFLKYDFRDKIYVYPHMKIDGSLIPIELLSDTKVYMCDYMEENTEVIDLMDCFYFDSDLDPNVPTKQPKLKTKERKQRLYIKSKRKRLRKMVQTYIKQNNVAGMSKLMQRHNLDEIRKSVIVKEEVGDIKNTTATTKSKKKKSKQRSATECQRVIAKTEPNEEIESPTMVRIRYMPVQNVQDIEKGKDMPDLSDNVLHSYETFEGDKNTKEKPDLNIPDGKVKTEYIDNEMGETVLDETEIAETELEVNATETQMDETGTGETNMENVTGQLVVQDGEHFVLVDGVLYKLESTEDGFVICQS